MKKLLIICCVFVFLGGVKAFAVTDCSKETGCASIEACITSLTADMIKVQRQLCGGPADTTKAFYSNGACTAESPVQNLWTGDVSTTNNYNGSFKANCDSDLIYKKPEHDAGNTAIAVATPLYFVAPVAAPVAAIIALNSVNNDGSGPCLWLSAGDSNYHFVWSKDAANGSPPEKDVCPTIKCLFADDIDGIVRRDGYNATVPKQRIESWNGMSVGKREYNDKRMGACKKMCSAYWITLTMLKAYEANLLAATSIRDQICTTPACTPGDTQCTGSTANTGYGDGTTSSTDDNIAGTSSGTTGSASGGSDGTGSAASSFAPSTSGSGEAAGVAASGKTWAEQLKEALGLSTTSGSPKFGSKGSGQQVTGYGRSSGGGTKKGILGVSPAEADLFALVTEGYKRNQGGLMGAEGSNNSTESSSPGTKTPIGTKPIIYK